MIKVFICRLLRMGLLTPVLVTLLGVFFILNQSPFKNSLLVWAMGGGACILFTLQLFFFRRQLLYYSKPIFVWLLLGFIVFLVSSCFLLEIGNHFKSTANLLIIFFLAFSSSLMLFHVSLNIRPINLILLCWCFLSFVFLFGYFFGSVEYGSKNIFSGHFLDRNFFAAACVILLSVSFYECINIWLRALLIGAVSTLVVVSGSMTGIMALVAFLIYFSSDKLSHRLQMTLIAICLIMLAGMMVFYPPFTSKLLSIVAIFSGGNVSDGSVMYRVWLIKEGFLEWLNHPFFGVGLDNSRLFLVPEFGRAENGLEAGMNTHFNIGETLLNRGLIGFLHWYGLLVFIYIKSRAVENCHYIRSLIVLYFVLGLGSVTNFTFIGNFLFFSILVLYFTHQYRVKLS